MINLIRKDFSLTFFTKASLSLIILYIPLINLVMGTSEPEKTIALMLISLSYILTVIPISYDRKSKPNVLIQSLPVKRRSVVISKYISIFINYVLGIMIVGGYLWIISLFGLRTVDSLTSVLTLNTLPVLIFSLSISLPIQIRAPLKIANMSNGFILAMLMSPIRSNDILINSNNIGEPVLFIIAAIAFLASMTLSIWMYEEQDLA